MYKDNYKVRKSKEKITLKNYPDDGEIFYMDILMISIRYNENILVKS